MSFEAAPTHAHGSDAREDRTIELRVASYNVHRCVGMDGQRRPARIAEIIRQMEVDVVGLQEVDTEPPGTEGPQAPYLSRATDLEAVRGPTIRRRSGDYGNLLLTRHPVRRDRRIDLSVPGREPRCAIDAELEVRGVPVRVLVAHLGLRAAERKAQAQSLIAALDERDSPVTLILGDMNEWLPWRRWLRRLDDRLGKLSTPATYPSRFPLFALDRIWADPASTVSPVKSVRDSTTAVASDHLPVRATLEISTSRSAAAG